METSLRHPYRHPFSGAYHYRKTIVMVPQDLPTL